MISMSGRTFVPSKTRAHEDSSLEECISTVWTRCMLYYSLKISTLMMYMCTVYPVRYGGQGRIQDFKKGGLLNNIHSSGGGCGRGTPPAQLGGLGERPSRQRFFILSCAKHYIKLHSLTLQELLDLSTTVFK